MYWVLYIVNGQESDGLRGNGEGRRQASKQKRKMKQVEAESWSVKKPLLDLLDDDKFANETWIQKYPKLWNEMEKQKRLS